MLIIFSVAPYEARISLSPFRIYNHEITILGSMAVLFSFQPTLDLLRGGVFHVGSLHTGSQGSSPAIIKGVVYITSSPWIEAFNATTGQELWKDNSNAETEPVVANGIVYIGSFATNGPNDTVSALNATNGGTLWSSTIFGSWGTDSPTVANGTLYIGNSQGTLYA